MEKALANAEFHWSRLIPDEDWCVYRDVLRRTQDRRLPFALGGGFAYSYYAGVWRDTKDLDLYILPEGREPLVQVLAESEFHDYFDKLPYDRRWIYRGYRGGLIVDLIWAMANQRAQVDERWLRDGPGIELRGLNVQVLALEELLWSKLYVLQRDRCDWPDILTLLYVRGDTVDWERLLARAGEDARLLGGVLATFAWMCPSRARDLPAWLWPRVGLQPPGTNHDGDADRRRINLLDSRDWFPPLRPPSAT